MEKEFRYVDTRTARVILVDGGDTLVRSMPVELSRRIRRDLEAMGVEIRLNSRVSAVEAHGVKIGDERIAAENVFWAAGVEGQSLTTKLGVELDRIGRIKVNADMSVPGYPDVFVVGDAAHAIDPRPPVTDRLGATKIGSTESKRVLVFWHTKSLDAH